MFATTIFRPLYSYLQVLYSYLQALYSYLQALYSYLQALYSYLQALYSYLQALYSYLQAQYSYLQALYSYLQALYSYLQALYSYLRLPFIINLYHSTSLIEIHFPITVTFISHPVTCYVPYTSLLVITIFQVMRPENLVSAYIIDLLSQYSKLGAKVIG